MSSCNSTESDMFSFLLFIVVWGKPNETVELYKITVTPSPFVNEELRMKSEEYRLRRSEE